MWLFTKYGFFSAVCAREGDGAKFHPVNPDRIMVRARRREHLEMLLSRFSAAVNGDLQIVESQSTDYRYRIFLAKSLWADIIKQLAEELDYDNFKSAVAESMKGLSGSASYMHSLHDVWQTMYNLQTGAEYADTAQLSESVDVVAADRLLLEKDQNGLGTQFDGYARFAEGLHPPLGEWNRGEFRKSPDPIRLAMLRHHPAGGVGGERGHLIGLFVGEADLASSLLLGIDLAYAFLRLSKNSFESFVDIRRHLHLLRRVVQGEDSPHDGLNLALSFLNHSPLTSATISDSEGAAYAAHATKLVTEAVAYACGHFVNQIEKAEAVISPNPYFSEGNSRETLFNAIHGRVKYIGRRCFMNRLVDPIVHHRAEWLADRHDQYLPPSPSHTFSLIGAVGTENALKYMRKHGLVPASRVDGGIAFRFRLGSKHLSKSGDVRLVMGYAFDSQGEAWYVVGKEDSNNCTDFTIKRTWKAHAEYHGGQDNCDWDPYMNYQYQSTMNYLKAD